MKKDAETGINNRIFSAAQKRFVAVSMAAVVLCMLIFTVITLLFYSMTLFSKVDENLERQEHAAWDMIQRQNGLAGSHMVPRNGEFPPVMDMKQPPGEQDRRVIFFLITGDSVSYLSPNPYLDEEEIRSLSLSNEKITGFSYNGAQFRGKGFTSGDCRIGVLTNVDSEIDAMRRLVLVLAAGFLLLLAVCYGMARFLSKKALDPVRESYAKQVFFVQDASHEMRTPLAVIKGKTELLATHPFDKVEDHYEDISQIMSEVVSMERMNKNLLTLSKEDVDDRLAPEHFQLEILANEIREFFTVLAQSQEKEFTILLPEHPAEVFWDFGRMKQALLILLDNAFKYTGEGDHISLHMQEVRKNIVIRVADTGIGMDGEDLKRIFDRFYRSSTVRGKNISGSGIGLSILKSLSRSMGFKVEVASNLGQGTVFTLTVPKQMKQ